MPKIGLPGDGFLNAGRGYGKEPHDRGVDTALFRETLQNSLDAGATRVDFILRETENEKILEVRDNGCGMDWPTLERGMLTYGGSVKPPGAVGGFGGAKNLICFATKWTEIHTLGNHVRIQGTDYEVLSSGQRVPGARIVMCCDKLDSDRTRRLDPTREGLEYLLKRSVLRRCTITFNGEVLKVARLSVAGREPVKTWSWGASAYHFKRTAPLAGKQGNDIAVCVRGLHMFSVAQPADVKGAILINIERDSTQVLNDSRSNFSSMQYRYDLNWWVESLTKSASATLRPRCILRRFTGRGLPSAQEIARRLPGLTLPGEPDGLSGGGAASIVSPAWAGWRGTAGGVAADKTEDLPSSSPWARDFMLRNERGRAVPKCYLPQHMGPRVKRLMNLWTHFVGLLLLLNRRNVTFGVGLIFSDDAAAMHHRDETGVSWFLLNPRPAGRRMLRVSNPDDLRDLIDSAAHEVAHFLNRGDNGHGDTFVVEYSRQMALAGKYARWFRRLRRPLRVAQQEQPAPPPPTTPRKTLVRKSWVLYDQTVLEQGAWHWPNLLLLLDQESVERPKPPNPIPGVYRLPGWGKRDIYKALTTMAVRPCRDVRLRVLVLGQGIRTRPARATMRPRRPGIPVGLWRPVRRAAVVAPRRVSRWFAWRYGDPL